jgi:glutathione S-transferase
MSLNLVIGNKNYSSWSMRPWMVLKEFAIPFRETVAPLYREESKATLLGHSPAGKAPSLSHDGFVVWDSLAIIEYIAELFPEHAIWPRDLQARARARSLSCEMHSGFVSLRKECPMNFRRAPSINPSEKLLADVARIEQAWSDARSSHGAGGPFLFGPFSAADAMFAPIVNRLDAYSLPASAQSRAYMDVIKALSSWREWAAGAQTESWVIEQFEIRT